MRLLGAVYEEPAVGVPEQPPLPLTKRPPACSQGEDCIYLNNISPQFQPDHWYRRSHPCRWGSRCPYFRKQASKLTESDITHLYAYSHPSSPRAPTAAPPATPNLTPQQTYRSVRPASAVPPGDTVFQ
eukprot:Sspe_Gene.93991::Locus_66476_Transcript_2_2_Confidence_0.667_Length_421::g.93991::m.93991